MQDHREWPSGIAHFIFVSRQVLTEGTSTMAIDQVSPSSLLDVQQLLSLLTIEEKISLLSGADEWQTQGIERLGIGSLKVG